MTVTTEAAFYDEAMVEVGSPALLPLDESGWAPLYREAASWIHQADAVVDLGCGTGRFGHALHERDHYGGFTGIDFSAAAIEEADRYLTEIGYEHRLEVADLREWAPSGDRPGNTVFVCLETLEHLADDVELVRRVPPGHRVIFSLPNYDSAAHLRTIRNVGDLWKRYGKLVTLQRWSLVDLGGDRYRVHVVDATRRADSW